MSLLVSSVNKVSQLILSPIVGKLHDLVRTKGMDVVAITETLLHQRLMYTEFLDSNYVIFHHDRQQGQCGGGVLLCLKRLRKKAKKSSSFYHWRTFRRHWATFVKGRSCVTSLLRSTFVFAKALEEKKQLDAVFLDYSKAFDSV